MRDRLEQLLETIPSMFQNSRIPESGFGAAVKVRYSDVLTISMHANFCHLYFLYVIFVFFFLSSIVVRTSNNEVLFEYLTFCMLVDWLLF